LEIAPHAGPTEVVSNVRAASGEWDEVVEVRSWALNHFAAKVTTAKERRNGIGLGYGVELSGAAFLTFASDGCAALGANGIPNSRGATIGTRVFSSDCGAANGTHSVTST
jgi:hypothetical protein